MTIVRVLEVAFVSLFCCLLRRLLLGVEDAEGGVVVECVDVVVAAAAARLKCIPVRNGNVCALSTLPSLFLIGRSVGPFPPSRISIAPLVSL